jgi:hypothetical protein
MRIPEHVTKVRGARDLVELWRALPAGALRYAVSSLPYNLNLVALSGTLRARAWREHCAAAPAICVEHGRNCLHADEGGCRADVLFPMLRTSGGAKNWRMATLFIRWWPSVGALHLIALGQTARDAMIWAARCIEERNGLGAAEPLAVSSFADLELRGASHWRLTFVSPWLIKQREAHAAHHAPDAATVAYELANSMKNRAKKLTSLCIGKPLWQRLGTHLADHVSEALMRAVLHIEDVRISVIADKETSFSNKQEYKTLKWTGHVILRIEEGALPWLSLLAVCGGGENADKGFGALELIPLQ